MAVDDRVVDCKTVTESTVAVIVFAVLGTAPSMPSQMVKPLCTSRFAPGQSEITHCNEPSPIVRPEEVLVTHRKVRLPVAEQARLE